MLWTRRFSMTWAPQISIKTEWYKADLATLDEVIGMGAEGRRARIEEIAKERALKAEEYEQREREREARTREQTFAALRAASAELNAKGPRA